MSDAQKLVIAAAKGNEAKVKRLLKAKADVNSTAVNKRGSAGTALQVSCGNGHVGTVRLLFKGGMTVKEINAAFGERAGELKKPAKRVGLIDMGLIHLFMM